MIGGRTLSSAGVKLQGQAGSYREVPNRYFPQAQSILHPFILNIAVTVFVCTQRNGNVLNRVQYRGTKVIRRIYLPLCACSMMPKAETSK
jgi:hypothetical protein